MESYLVKSNLIIQYKINYCKKKISFFAFFWSFSIIIANSQFSFPTPLHLCAWSSTFPYLNYDHIMYKPTSGHPHLENPPTKLPHRCVPRVKFLASFKFFGIFLIVVEPPRMFSNLLEHFGPSRWP